MIARKRVRLFKIITALAAGFMLIVLGTGVYNLCRAIKQAPGIDAYAGNQAINRRNQAFAMSNPWGFTDKPRATAKPKGTYRIAVLGDSFIWGDGLPYEQVWSHKLEQKILAEYNDVEVMSWGRCGWSTLDEFNFYKQHGKDYNIDLLIIGWVDNDPDVGKYKQVAAIDPKIKYPLVWKIYPALAQRWANAEEGNNYNAWNDSLFTTSNLKAYGQLLDTMKVFFDDRNVKLLYVLTPGGLNQDTKTNFLKVERVLANTGAEYLDLLPGVAKKLGKYPAAQLQANPVNSHPGGLMTEEFANEVLAYLKTNGYLAKKVQP